MYDPRYNESSSNVHGGQRARIQDIIARLLRPGGPARGMSKKILPVRERNIEIERKAGKKIKKRRNL